MKDIIAWAFSMAGQITLGLSLFAQVAVSSYACLMCTGFSILFLGISEILYKHHTPYAYLYPVGGTFVWLPVYIGILTKSDTSVFWLFGLTLSTLTLCRTQIPWEKLKDIF